MKVRNLISNQHGRLHDHEGGYHRTPDVLNPTVSPDSENSIA